MNLVIQKRGSYQYVSIRESFWDKARKKYSSRTVKNFGRLDRLLAEDPDALEKIREEVEALRAQRQAERDDIVRARYHAFLEEKLSEPRPPVEYTLGHLPYMAIWERFDVDDVVPPELAPSLFLWMVRRLLDEERLKLPLTEGELLDEVTLVAELRQHQDELVAALNERIDIKALPSSPKRHALQRRALLAGDVISYVALLHQRLLEKALREAGVTLSTRRIADALRSATVIEVLDFDVTPRYLFTNTDGDFLTVAQVFGFRGIRCMATPEEFQACLAMIHHP